MGIMDLLKSEEAKDLLDKSLDKLKDNLAEEAIEKLIDKLEDMGLTENEMIKKLMDQFDLSAKDAEKYLKKYVKKLLKK